MSKRQAYSSWFSNPPTRQFRTKAALDKHIMNIMFGFCLRIFLDRSTSYNYFCYFIPNESKKPTITDFCIASYHFICLSFTEAR